MRVSAINTNSYGCNQKPVLLNSLKNTPPQKLYEFHHVLSDKIEFTSRNTVGLNKLASLKIPCIYCGRPTIEGSRYTKMTASGFFEKPVKQVLPLLQEFVESFHPTELKVYKLLKNQSENFPKLTIQQILQIAAPKHARKLVIQQLPVFNNLLDIGKELPKEKYKALYEIINHTVEEVIEKYPECTYSNIGFINKISPIVFDNSDSVIDLAFKDECTKLPSSHQNLSAFIAKYARTNSNRIVFAMGEPSFFSKEDLMPRFLNGKPGFDNYGIACKGDNRDFGHILMSERVKMKPETIGFTQKQIDYMINLANKGEIPGEAVEKMADLYMKYMGEALTLDTSKLDYNKIEKSLLNRITAQCFFNKLKKYGIEKVSVPPEYTLLYNCNKVKNFSMPAV